jgi:hypothetical protein
MKNQQARLPKATPRRNATGTKAATNEQPPCRIQRTIPDELTDTVADRLKRSLRYANLRNHEMAARLSLHPNTIGGYVTGRTKMLPVVMRLWATETGVPLSWLKTGDWHDEAV